MINEVRKYIEKEDLLKPKSLILVGLSGGMDSMALLDILVRLGYKCIAAHCNFHLRKEESNRDAKFVKEWCIKTGVEIISTEFDTYLYAKKNKLSIEMAARELRYSWFDRMRQEKGTDVVAIAHHKDDSVETVLLNLIRGTGIKGLTGIASRNNYVVRPLLGLKRLDIEAYIKERDIPHIEDSTNSKDIYVRNSIRLNILPALENINVRAKEAIHRASMHLNEVEKIYSHYINENVNQLFQNNLIDIKLLKNTISPQTVLFEILFPLGFNPNTIDAIYRSLEGESGKFFYSDNYRLIKDRDFLILDLIKNDIKTKSISQNYTINKGVNEVTHPVHLTFKIETMPISIKRDNRFLYVDAEKLIFPLKLRKWSHGDWFIPFGMKGKKKLSDFFTDIKLNIKEKEEVWLLTSEDKIVWILGKRSDNRFRITENTDKALVVELRND